MSKQEIKKDDTYELIVNTAKKLFFTDGKFNATTQEIADAAGVNRTLINYYFRSRDVLFDLVFKEAKFEEDKQQEIIALSDVSFREKIEKFLDFSLENAKKYPFMEMYMVTHMNQHNLCELTDSEHIKRMLSKLYVEIKDEMKEGNIQKMEPVQFLLNFISMVSFPICMRPLIQQSMEISNEEYDRILSERKQVILNTIFIK